jgi:DnaA family protein
MTISCLQTPTQYSLDIALPRFATFETYIDSSDGKLLSLLEQIVRVAPVQESGSKLGSKPDQEPQQYFLWGSLGTGKTHLLQAICNRLVNTEQKVIYLPMKELVNQPEPIFSDMQQLDVVCIDDVDAVLGNQQWDRQLFLLINDIRESNKSLVMTAMRNPHEASVSMPDLASRLVWGPVYKLNYLEDEEKSFAIQAHAKARGLEVSAEVCSFLLKRFPRDLKKLIELLDKLDAESLVQQRKVTVPFVKSVLNLV